MRVQDRLRHVNPQMMKTLKILIKKEKEADTKSQNWKQKQTLR